MPSEFYITVEPPPAIGLAVTPPPEVSLTALPYVQSPSAPATDLSFLAGGTAGQRLDKASNTDFDFTWADVRHSFYNIEDHGAAVGEDITEILQTAVNFAAHRTTVYIPANYYFISDTIEFPTTYGGTIYGAGMGANSGNTDGNNHNDGCARLIWTGGNTAGVPMFKMPGSNLVIDGGLTLIGKTDGTADANRCNIGILVTKGTGVGTGKNHINAIMFQDFDTCFQCGLLSSEGNLDNLTFTHFATQGKCDTVYKIVGNQSMKHNIWFLHNRATCTRVFQVYGGGLVYVAGGLTFGSTLLEIPDGTSGIGSNNGMFRFDNIKVDDQATTDFKAIDCLRNATGFTAIYNNLFIANDDYVAEGKYCFGLWGRVRCVMRDCRNLQAGMIKSLDHTQGKPSILMDNCHCPDGSGGEMFYTGTDAYYFRQRNCYSGGALVPFDDVTLELPVP